MALLSYKEVLNYLFRAYNTYETVAETDVDIKGHKQQRLNNTLTACLETYW